MNAGAMMRASARRALLAVFGALLLAVHAPDTARAQGSYPDLNRYPSVEQVPLSEDSARNAVYAYRDLKARYSDELPSSSESASWMQALAASAGMQATVQSHGFGDTEEWYRTFMSFIVAYIMGVQGNQADVENAIAQIQASDQLPDTVKTQLLARLTGFLPMDGNVSVAESLSQDAEIMGVMTEFQEQ